MNKWRYPFGITLLIMAILSFYTATSLSCIPYYDYGDYMFCRHFRNGQMIEAIICFIGSMWCFESGGRNE